MRCSAAAAARIWESVAGPMNNIRPPAGGASGMHSRQSAKYSGRALMPAGCATIHFERRGVWGYSPTVERIDGVSWRLMCGADQDARRQACLLDPRRCAGAPAEREPRTPTPRIENQPGRSTPVGGQRSTGRGRPYAPAARYTRAARGRRRRPGRPDPQPLYG